MRRLEIRLVTDGAQYWLQISSSDDAASFLSGFSRRAFLDRLRSGGNITTLTFDTLQFVQRLKKAGIKEEEAEAIAEAVRDVQASADLATKQDVALLQQNLAVH